MQPWMGPWEHHTPPGAGSTNRTHFSPNWTTPAGRVETPYSCCAVQLLAIRWRMIYAVRRLMTFPLPWAASVCLRVPGDIGPSSGHVKVTTIIWHIDWHLVHEAYPQD